MSSIQHEAGARELAAVQPSSSDTRYRIEKERILASPTAKSSCRKKGQAPLMWVVCAKELPTYKKHRRKVLFSLGLVCFEPLLLSYLALCWCFARPERFEGCCTFIATAGTIIVIIKGSVRTRLEFRTACNSSTDSTASSTRSTCNGPTVGLADVSPLPGGARATARALRGRRLPATWTTSRSRQRKRPC